MEKKNKKKLFAIIGGSVLAFVLTIALSVSITLAYFGGTGTNTQSVTLGANVSVADEDGAAGKVTLSEEIDNALPGQVIGVTVDANIMSSGTQRAAVLLMIEGDLALDNIAEGWTHYGTATDGAETDPKTYTVYILGTTTAMKNVEATSSGTAMTQFSGDYTVSPSYKNGDEGKDVASVTAVVVAVQYGTTPDVTSDSLGFGGEDDVLTTIFEDVAGVTFTAA